MGVAKVTLNGTTLIDTTGKTVTSSTMLSGATALDRKGDSIVGTYTDSDFVVTLSYNETTDLWEPDCTFAEAKAAYDAGKNIVGAATNDYTPVYFIYSEYESCFYYAVHETSMDTSGIGSIIVEKAYYLDSNGVHDDGGLNLYETASDTATPSQVLSGATFHNASGYQTGTMPENSAFPPALSLNSSTGVITGTNAFSEGHYSALTSSSTLSLTTQPATTWTPGTTNQTISSGRYLTGDQTIKGDSNLVASNIASGVSIFGVSGTYEGGVSSIYKSIYNRTITGMTNDVINAFLNQSTTIPSYAFAGWNYSSLSALNSVNNAQSIGEFAFYNCYSLTTADFPSVKIIGGGAFYNCIKLSLISFPVATTIGPSTFQNCTSLTTADFPSATSIGNYAFYNCSKLSSISFPSATTIRDYAFYSCIKLSSISFPVATSIGSSAFYSCSKLSSISFPSATSIGSYAFAMPSLYDPTYGSLYVYSLKSVYFPLVTLIGEGAFRCRNNLSYVSFPAAISIRNYCFSNCISLETANFSAVTYIGNAAFYHCSNLTLVSFPAATTISTNAFNGCAQLSSAYFLGSSVPTAGAVIFINTPIAASTYLGYYGSIFVRESLADAFCSATNWAAYSSRIVGLTDAEIEALS